MNLKQILKKKLLIFFEFRANYKNLKMSKNKKPEQKCLKGINYGSFDMSSEFLRCLYQEGNIFKVPFEKIENCSSINKNEVLVELNTNDANDEYLYFNPI